MRMGLVRTSGTECRRFGRKTGDTCAEGVRVRRDMV